MDFAYTEEEEFIKDTARRYAEAELAPYAQHIDSQHDYKLLSQKAKELASLGFVGFNVAEEYGGSEAGPVAYSLAITEIAKACAATALTLSVTNMVAEVIHSVGNETQKSAYLPRLCCGDYKAGSFCLTEASAGSDPTSMKSRATKTSGSGWRINGTKQWISSAPFCGIFVVWAVTDPQAPRGKGITCFLVEADRPGITVAQPQHKLGQNGSPTCDVHFDDVEVDESAILGKLNDGYRIAVTELTGGRIGIASLALGIGQAALEYAIKYSMEREQFGKRIAEFQGLQWMLVDRATELEAARLLILQAACRKKNKLTFTKEASMAKVFATEKANQTCYTALQVLGGYGYMKDFPIERYTRDVRITSIYEGTSEIQRLIIGREILKEYS